MKFPYISQISVNNCFTYKNFAIPHKELTVFKHIILTGENGSGKTTILNRIAFLLSSLQEGMTCDEVVLNLESLIKANPHHPQLSNWKQQIIEARDIKLKHLHGLEYIIKEKPNNYIFSYFKAHRKIELKDVSTVTKEDEFISKINNQRNTEDFIGQFKQYLVNKKVYEAFDFMNGKKGNVKVSERFFSDLTETLRSLFKDEKLKLEFIQESFEFYLILKDERRLTFNQLSEGFSAFLSILMDILIRIDLLKKINKDYELEPQGIVLIDEPETHLHLSMQYEILPLISKLFPKVQLIIATHSPAIISSLKNSVIYDLTSRDEISDRVIGSSFSELMVTHFGLDNEYSSIADNIILEINNAVKEKDAKYLKQVLIENEKFLTASLKLEIESQIIYLNSKE